MKYKILNKPKKDFMPARGFGNFDPNIIIREGNGARVWDTCGHEYIDFLIGSGPMLLGHRHPEVIDVVKAQLEKGTTFFANNEPGLQLAEEICNAVSCAEQIRYTSSGGEADMYAMRLARAFTKRDKLVKFEGGYHGMSAEAQMSLAPKTLANFPNPVPDSAGIPRSVSDDILIAPFNDCEFIKSLIHEHAGNIAGIIVEPFQRIIPPAPGFLEVLREECTKHNIVLIFDEIVTGFRLAYGGAQDFFGVVPDICTLGKIIGGGFPLAAIAGRTKIMSHFDENKVGSENFLMHHGTLNGNPIAAVAGLKTMEILRCAGQYEKLFSIGEKIMEAFSFHLDNSGIEHQIVGCPALFDIVFSNLPINNYRDFLKRDVKKEEKFNKLLRQYGILKSPNKLYMSLALDDDDIKTTYRAIELAVNKLLI